MKKFLIVLLSAVLSCFCCLGCGRASGGGGSGGDDSGGGTGKPPVEDVTPMETFPADTLGDSLNDDYRSVPFYNDRNDTVAYVCNAMWDMFGSVTDGQNLVIKFGNEATWFKWLAEKIMWSGDTGYISQLKSKILDYPQVDNGFIWSWTTTPYWTVNRVNSLHYDGTFRYISAVYEIIAWENSTSFLEQTDTSRFGSDSALDASKGKTVYEKVKSAMNYILNNLEGEKGHIRITEKSVVMNDGVNKFFDEWDNTGKFGSSSSNYWDNLCFGNFDAYENALFYESLEAMAGIERALGKVQEAEKYESLMKTVKSKYDELYYSSETGRYISTIDTDNVKHDYGLTFLNFEALKYGLGDKVKAKSVLDWVDGVRTVTGDTVTGKSILSYSDIINEYYRQVGSSERIPEGLVLAPRSNTVSYESKSENSVSWWHNPNGAISEFTNARYNMHLENGGYIFYTVYYELMTRAEYQGADSVIKRLQQIADVYKFNKLNSDIGNWLEGLCGEFPESGLTPCVYLYALCGIRPEVGALTVAPQFGTAYSVLGVQKVVYGGKSYAIETKKDGSATIKGTGVDMTLEYKPAAGKKVTAVCKNNVGGTVKTVTADVDSDGFVTLDLNGLTAVYRVNITAE